MPIIYTPSGMAREYSPYSANLYIGCSHRCCYCYAPHTIQRSAENYFGVPSPRKNVIHLMEKDLQENTYDKQIFLSFIGDVYCENTDNSATTRQALQLLNKYKAPVAVCSKGGSRMLKDLDVFKKFGKRISVGATLTFLNEQTSRDWEPGAATPKDRLLTLRELHDSGVHTFASFEPVIDPLESLRLLKFTLEKGIVDHYKIGKLNNYKGLDKGVDWRAFLIKALEMLRESGKTYYIKKCLAAFAPDVELSEEERDYDRWIVRA